MVAHPHPHHATTRAPTLPPAPTTTSRRAALATPALLAAVAAASTLAGPPPASAAVSPRGRGMAAYVRKRALGPIETYVPPLLAARAQLLAVDGLIDADPREARSRLRSGAFAGLRDNVRAVGEYAATAGNAPAAAAAIPTFFTAVERLDYLLFDAVRSDRAPDGATARRHLADAVAALDAVVAGVPADVAAAARRVADAAAVDGGDAGGVAPAEVQAIVPDVVEK